MKRVTIIDYGSGNLRSVARALEHCGAVPVLSSDPDELAHAERLLLPGVGAFADGMAELRERGLVEPIRRFAASGRPVLGICLGMQMLSSVSEEFGVHEGLGLIPGRVVPLPKVVVDGRVEKIPHMGWEAINDTAAGTWSNSILEKTAPGASVYLVHSYQVVPDNLQHVLATYSFGDQPITAAIRSGNVSGCQFHPEKSGPEGLRILSAFMNAAAMVNTPQ
jgi:glutamine amidotransferase